MVLMSDSCRDRERAFVSAELRRKLCVCVCVCVCVCE